MASQLVVPPIGRMANAAPKRSVMLVDVPRQSIVPHTDQ
jgi:hypothetical protein